MKSNWLTYALGAAGAALVGYSMLKPNEGEVEAPDDVSVDDSPAVYDEQTVMGYSNGSPTIMTVRAVGNGAYLRQDAANTFNMMSARALVQDGVRLVAGSGFRSMLSQTGLYAAYVARFFTAPTVAKPGYSNHQNGTAMDVADATGRSITYGSPEFNWLQNNGILYGWSWDEGKKVNEPWHWRYIG